MSKLSFRARALDASKPMPIYLSEELPDLPEYLSINRSVPQMPSGMEKEEESERHLQEAISAGTVIPTPEVFCITDLGHTDRLDLLYPAIHKVPKQYVHYQSYAFDSDVPEYDMDSEDERWINAQTKKMDVPLSVNQFEEMMDRLEKGSGQQVVTLKEAKMLVQEDDDLIVAVYDYWLNKRLKMQYPLIPAVKTEKSLGGGGGSAVHSANPYVAFRRRLEKMQTRKNRKNDEVSYEKMLKLRRNLSRAVTILEMMKRREKMKKEHLHLTVEIFEKRYSVGDYSGQLLSEAASSQKTTASHQLYRGGIAQHLNNNNSHHLLHRPSFAPSPLLPSQQQQHVWPSKHRDSTAELKSKRSYKKRKHSRAHLNSTRSAVSGDVVIDTVTSDEEERCRPRPARSRTLPTSHSGAPADQWQDEPEPDGPFTFHRTRGCQYHDATPWRTTDAGETAGLRPDTPPLPAERRFRLGSIRRPQRRTLGLIRQRLGRGGRVIIDRTRADTESELRALGITVPRGHTLSLHDLPHFLPPEQESAPSPMAAAAVDSSCSSRESSPSPPPSQSPASSPHSSSVISSLQQSRQTVSSGPAVQQSVVGCSRFQLRPTAAAASDEDAVALLSELLMNGDSGGSSVTARSVMNGAAAAVTIGDSGGVAVTRSADSDWRPARRMLVNTTAQTQCGAPVSVRQQLSSWRQQLSGGNALLADTPPLHSIHTTKPNSHRIREVSAPLKRQLSSVSPRPLLKMKKLVRKDQLSLNAS